MKLSSSVIKERGIAYAVATIGLFLVAIGIALSIYANLGTPSLSCPPTILSAFALSVGRWTMIWNMFYLLLQVALLRRQFDPKSLMQIPATLIFGLMIDAMVFCFQFLEPSNMLSRSVLNLAACLATAMGVSIEVYAKAWMLSAESLVAAIAKVTRWSFPVIKVAGDVLLVVFSVVISYICFDNPFGRGTYSGVMDIITGTTPGVVIGVGTLLLAVLVGNLMHFTNPVAEKLMKTLHRHFLNDV